MKKSCQPNWEHNKMLALIKAKRDEHLANMEMVDARNQFEIIKTKVKVNIYNCNE